VLEKLVEPGMMIPAAVAAGGLLVLAVIAPVDLDEGDAGFDQTPRQQARLPKAGPAVAIAQPRRFGVEVERSPGRGRREQIDGLGAEPIHAIFTRGPTVEPG